MLNEITTAIKDAGMSEVFSSEEETIKAAKSLGFNDDQIAQALEESKNLELTDEELDNVAGGNCEGGGGLGFEVK